MEQQLNAADESQVKEAGKKEKNKRNQEIDDVNFVLSSKQGRRLFWRYISRCGVFKTSMTGNNSTFFNEGERNIGLLLLADVNEAAPDAYVLMQKEANEQKPIDKKQNNKNNKEETSDV